MPYTAAFTGFENTPLYADIINAMIDVAFLLDILINFRTSYIKEATGEEVVRFRDIAIQYIKMRFWIDLIASIPVDIIGFFVITGEANSATLQMFGLLKLVRVLRLSRLITYMNLKNDIKMSLKLLKLIFFLVLYLHALA